MHGQGRVRGVDEGRRGNQDGPPATNCDSCVVKLCVCENSDGRTVMAGWLHGVCVSAC